MVASINRNVAHGDPMTVHRKPISYVSTPLQVFGQAKKQINNIFNDIQAYVADASEHMIGRIITLINCTILYFMKYYVCQF